jgi:hypothetical protein
LTEGITTAFGGVRIPVGPPNLSLYGTVGVRYIYSGTKLSITGPLGVGTTQSVYKNWVDPVAGIAGQYKFDDRLFMNTLFDFGGWSDSATGQGLASVGYNWTQNIATTLGLSRALHLREAGHRLQLSLRAQKLPLPAVDVRAVRRLQVQLLKPRRQEAVKSSLAGVSFDG